MQKNYKRLLAEHRLGQKPVEEVALKVRLTSPDGLETWDRIVIRCKNVEGLARFARIRLDQIKREFQDYTVELTV